MRTLHTLAMSVVAAALLIVLTSCSGSPGGSGSGSGNGNGNGNGSGSGSFTVGGTVSGLKGSGLVLQDNGGDNLAVSANGAFTFATALDSGAAYKVTVLSQPTVPAQTCTVANGSGKATSNVGNVHVTCSAGTLSVSGSVSGLSGTGLVLQAASRGGPLVRSCRRRRGPDPRSPSGRSGELGAPRFGRTGPSSPKKAVPPHLRTLRGGQHLLPHGHERARAAGARSNSGSPSATTRSSPRCSARSRSTGATLFVCVSAAPVTSRRLFEKVLPARAVENAAPLVYVNRVGVEDAIVFGGGSRAYDARGEPLAERPVPGLALGPDERLISVELDTAEAGPVAAVPSGAPGRRPAPRRSPAGRQLQPRTYSAGRSVRRPVPPAKSLAQQLAAKQREISVAEFFERNRQILGFDNPLRALLTTVKEAVDNGLDACEEAHVLPGHQGRDLQGGDRPRSASPSRTTALGSCKREIPNVFGRLLYGSRFHANRQSRGQQGIGISAAVLYAGLTTARPAKVTSKVAEEEAAHVVELLIDTQKNLPRVVSEDLVLWDRPHGTRIELLLKAKYIGGASRHSTT